MNKGERSAAEEYQERKRREAQREKDIVDADSWWVKNKKRFVKMDVGKCHEYLSYVEFNREVRPKVRLKICSKIFVCGKRSNSNLVYFLQIIFE